MSVYKTSKSRNYYIGLMVQGKRIQFSARTDDIDEAREMEYILKKRMGGLARDRFIAMVDALLDDGNSQPTNKYALLSRLHLSVEEILKTENPNIKEKSLLTKTRICERFVRWLATNKEAVRLVSDISTEIAWRFVTSIDGKAKTKQNIVGELSAVWKMLMRMGLVSDNPWRNARPASNSSEARSGRAFTPDEIRAILSAPAMTDEMRTATLIALYTGLRQVDVFALEWANINWKTEMIEVEPSKTSRFKIRVRCPISPTLLNHLKTLKKRGRCVIARKPSHPERIWNTCLKQAGIEAEGNEMMTFHNLRHTFATWLREAGADKGTQMQLGGWTNVSTANRYDHNTTQLKETIMKIPIL
jgi:integrase